jgi:hypothetical protein
MGQIGGVGGLLGAVAGPGEVKLSGMISQMVQPAMVKV